MNPIARLPTLSSRDRRTLTRGVAAIAFVLIVGKGLPAWLRWQDEVRAAANELEAHAAEAHSLVSAFPALRDSLHERSARLHALDAALVGGDTPGAAAATLASLVTDAAQDAGIKVASLEPRADTAATPLGAAHTHLASDAFVRVSVRGELTGDVVGIMQFLADIEHGPVLLAVRDLSIAQPDPAAPTNRMETLRGDVTIEGLARRVPRNPDAQHAAIQVASQVAPRSHTGRGGGGKASGATQNRSAGGKP